MSVYSTTRARLRSCGLVVPRRVELYEPLCGSVQRDGRRAPAGAREVGGQAADAQARTPPHAPVVVVEVAPEAVELRHGVGMVRELREDGADHHHDDEVVDHVAAQGVRLDVLVEVVGPHHDASDLDLLVDPARHDLLVHRLVLPPDEVAVEVHVQVVEGAAARQGDVGVDVVHVEGVRRHGHPAVAQHVGAVAEGVHEEVLGHLEVADVVPAKGPAHGEHRAVVDHVAAAVLHVLVHVVADDEVHALAGLVQLADLAQKGGAGLGVQPVVGVHDLEVGPLGVSQALEDGHAMAAVLLVHGLHDAGVALLPGLCLGQRVVLRGPVVHDDDLDVLGVARTLENGPDAMVHVLGGVVARHAKADRLLLTRLRHQSDLDRDPRLVVGDDLVGELESGDGDAVHVVVAVLGEAAHHVEVDEPARAVAVATVELEVLGLVDDIVRGLAHAGDVAAGVLAHDGRLAREDLAGEVLELRDAGEVLAHGVVDGAHGLELVHVQGLEDHVERAVRQCAEVEAVELVQGTGVDDLAAKGPAADVDHAVRRAEEVPGVDAHVDLDQVVVEHALEHGGVAVGGHALVGRQGEVAVVVAHEDGNAAHDGGVDLVGRLAPLLHRVVQEDVLVDVVRHLGEVGVVLLAQLHDGDLLVHAEGRDELLEEPLSPLLAEGELEGRVVEGDGHEGAMHVGEDLVLVLRPVGEAREELERALVGGVEDVRAVLVHEDARLVPVVVGVARHMAAALEDADLEAAGLGQTARADGTGVSGPHDDGVEGGGVEVVRKACVEVHGRFPSMGGPHVTRALRTNKSSCRPLPAARFLGRFYHAAL